ncbi:MAG: hypothetical protein IPP20_18235 [Gemmatimonadetes bacterium]|nr:hypothetical protein [Gemmatimonadota bacterium]
MTMVWHNRGGEMYLDQNSGSILVQAIVGGAVGIGAIVKLYWFKLRTFGRRAEDSSRQD